MPVSSQPPSTTNPLHAALVHRLEPMTASTCLRRDTISISCCRRCPMPVGHLHPTTLSGLSAVPPTQPVCSLPAVWPRLPLHPCCPSCHVLPPIGTEHCWSTNKPQMDNRDYNDWPLFATPPLLPTRCPPSCNAMTISHLPWWRPHPRAPCLIGHLATSPSAPIKEACLLSTPPTGRVFFNGEPPPISPVLLSIVHRRLLMSLLFLPIKQVLEHPRSSSQLAVLPVLHLVDRSLLTSSSCRR
jgi:hypothetical protein